MTTHHPSTEATGAISEAPRAGWWGRWSLRSLGHAKA